MNGLFYRLCCGLAVCGMSTLAPAQERIAEAAQDSQPAEQVDQEDQSKGVLAFSERTSAQWFEKLLGPHANGRDGRRNCRLVLPHG